MVIYKCSVSFSNSYLKCSGTTAVASKKSDQSFVFDHGAASIPHPDKKEKGGEDDFFETDVAIGVADGKHSYYDENF